MIQFILNVFGWLLRDSKRVAVIIIMIFSAIFVLLRNQIDEQKREIDILTSNCLFYLNRLDGLVKDNHVLLLTLDDLKCSNDSLVKEIKDKQKELNIKNKELSQAALQKLVINIDTTLVVKKQDFYLEIKPNSLTSITINKKDSILNTRIDIKNSQTIFITNNRTYRRKYKNWFVRLLHLDFKKVTRKKYQIINSNDIIKTEDVRVVEIP